MVNLSRGSNLISLVRVIAPLFSYIVVGLCLFTLNQGREVQLMPLEKTKRIVQEDLTLDSLPIWKKIKND